MARVALGLVLVIACSSKPEPPRPAPEEPPPAHTEARAPSGEPLTAQHDEPPRTPGRPPARPGRPIEIVLRSSPQGAIATVDGVPLGPTPAYWGGDANGREHEFTFVLQGYASARYRFVPITSGVVHARLEPVAEETDAGVPRELVRMPREAPLAPLHPGPVAPPPAPPAPPAAPAAHDAGAAPVEPGSGTGPQP